MTSHAYVQGASEALVLHDRGWILLYARFMVILPTEGQQAPFYIFPAALAHEAGMDPWRKSSRHNTSHIEGLNEDLTLLPGCILAEHNFLYLSQSTGLCSRLFLPAAAIKLQIEKKYYYSCDFRPGKNKKKTKNQQPFLDIPPFPACSRLILPISLLSLVPDKNFPFSFPPDPGRSLLHTSRA